MFELTMISCPPVEQSFGLLVVIVKLVAWFSLGAGYVAPPLGVAWRVESCEVLAVAVAERVLDEDVPLGVDVTAADDDAGEEDGTLAVVGVLDDDTAAMVGAGERVAEPPPLSHADRATAARPTIGKCFFMSFLQDVRDVAVRH